MPNLISCVGPGMTYDLIFPTGNNFNEINYPLISRNKY